MHRLQCQCGALRGEISGKGTSSRVICYCSDCRAFANFLDRAIDVLDEQGGTEIVQVAQPRVALTQGREHLAAVRLSEKGTVRWYAACCNTPIGNTLANPKVSFIGLIHSPLDHSRLDQDFGSKVAQVNVASAIGTPKPEQQRLFSTILRFIWIILSARVGGTYRRSPFFNQDGDLVVSPRILTTEERRALKSA